MPPNQDYSKLYGLLSPDAPHDAITDDEERFTCPPFSQNSARVTGSCGLMDSLRQEEDNRLRCAIVGCGMMGQEHVSYILGYSDKLRIDFLCDPVSVKACCDQIEGHSNQPHRNEKPVCIHSEDELLKNHVNHIDLVVLAHPNHLHTDSILRWGRYEHLTVLLEKPVAVNLEQHARLAEFASSHHCKANIWVAMEYRFIPAISKLKQLIPSVVGDVHMVTIRENRFPFLHKVGGWNRHAKNTGDTLVEKCCHFFDLMRLLTSQEPNLDRVHSMVQRNINYQEEERSDPEERPIIDSAYVMMPFNSSSKKTNTMASLELCMFADGSRHQEEVIVTGSRGRLEAYLPENKVFAYRRPDHKEWSDRTIPPPKTFETVYDCNRENLTDVYDLTGEQVATLPEHGGYHYGSTAMEWYRLLEAREHHTKTGVWNPLVSLAGGLKAVEMGLSATKASEP